MLDKYLAMKIFYNLEKRGWQFILLTVILSVIPYYFIVKSESTDTSFSILLMWIPGITATIMRLYYKEGLFKDSSCR